ncbi:MAG: ABC transporter permease [Verrucomicrobia bacterium]|nr:ABC transporter permease [Verrucomicrobiota bacterium]
MKTSGTKAVIEDMAEGMRGQPGRILLSFISILIGIVSLTVLIAVLSGLRSRADLLVDEFGANTFAITTSTATNGDSSKGRLTQKIFELIAENLPNCRVAGVTGYNVDILESDDPLHLIACDPVLPDIRDWKIVEGRFFDERDSRQLERYAVLTLSLSRIRDWRVGETIMLNGAPFTVIGTMTTGSGGIESESGASSLTIGPETAFIPRSLPTYWVPNVPSEDRIDTIFVRIPAGGRSDEYVARTERILHAPEFAEIKPGWITPETLLERIRQLQRTIRLTLGSVAALCLILGCTALTSLMILNVRDRIKEIGLRRSLGATKRDVALLFVMEGGIITTAAGVVGVLLTTILLWLARSRFPIAPKFSTASLLLPILTAIILGALASLWPAIEAAKIAPSEALRND